MDNAINELLVKKMKIQIEQIGNDKIWNIIERFPFVETRIAYRKIFFSAGGIVPKTELKI